jgi:membrane fusion protein (multidrug efflux system)
MTFRFPGFFCSLATIVLIAASCGSKNNGAVPAKGGSGKPNFVSSEAFIVRQVAYAPVYTASGALLANEMIDIHPEVGGRVTGIFFREGSPVRKGQLLLSLNDADVRAQIAKLQAQKSLQQTTRNRQDALLKIGGISRQEYDATQTEITSLEADIAASQATLGKMKIVAPFDGIIGLRNISPGAIVSSETVVASLQQISPLKLDFTLPDQHRSQLRLGQDVRFFVDGSLDTMTGKISAIEPAADAMTHTVRARALVPNQSGKLLPGAFAHVIIAFDVQGTSILIPSQSIIPTTRDKKVALLRDGKAVMQTVRTGDRTEDRVQILEGLQVGDTILTTGLMQVKTGMEVKVGKLAN